MAAGPVPPGRLMRKHGDTVCRVYYGIMDDSKDVDYESDSDFSESSAASSAASEIGRAPMGDQRNRTSPEEVDGMDGEAASRKRGAPSTSDGSGRKRAKCEHGRQKRRCKDCGGSCICPHGGRATARGEIPLD